MAPASEVGRIEQNSSMPGFKNSLTLNVCCGLTPNSRRKADPFRSALSMLTFYINRAGKNLPASRRKTLQRAKGELRRQFGRD
jgi:hypothetical protein